MNDFYIYAVICILVSGVATFLTRLIPFALFSGGRQMPPLLKKMAGILPSAVIAVLVIYGVSEPMASLDMRSVAALAALLLTVGLHVWRKNTLLSMFGGTAAYMLMVHFI